MFRVSSHASFIVDNVLRLTRDNLDGAANNDLYPKDFFIDLIFTDARNQSNIVLGNSVLARRMNESIKGGKKGASSYVSYLPPEEEYKADLLVNAEEEEKRLMSGSKNLENKDDFWISIC